jgi:cystathionine gamma-lyase
MTSENFGTRAIHAGQRPDPTTGAIMTPVYLTSTYTQESPGKLKEGYDYSRSGNPTRTALEKNLASLEGARHGLCFASGCAALDAVLHQFEPGDRVIVSDDVYGGTNRLANRVYSRHGLDVRMVDLSDPATLRKSMNEKTKLVWLETPSNPMLKILDIERLAAIAHDSGALCAVDNTFATPYLQNPLALGADIVCHSATKYLGGHSDVVGGVLLVNDEELHQKLAFVQNAVGAVPSPMDCFLLLRSTKTLHVRMDRHCANARKIVEFLDGHRGVEKVIYPGLPSHPQHELAAKQMRDFGGMITMVLSGGLDVSRRFLERTHLFSLAESLGGVESLIEHPAIMTHASVPPEQRERLGISDGLVRLSVGIEDVDDLIADLEQALG